MFRAKAKPLLIKGKTKVENRQKERGLRMKSLSLVLTLVLVFVTASVFAVTYPIQFEDFEPPNDYPADYQQGWYLTAGNGNLTTAQNHTTGGEWSDHLTSGSTSYTNMPDSVTVVPSTQGVLDYWVYTDGSGDPTYGGYYDVAEIFLKDDNNAIVAQLYIRPFGVRNYQPTPYQATIPGSANQYVVGQWNHITLAYDYVAGTLDLTVNNWSYSFSQFGLTDGKTGTGVISYTWTHNNRNGADIYLDDVQLVPEPTSISLLGVLGLALLRRKK